MAGGPSGAREDCTPADSVEINKQINQCYVCMHICVYIYIYIHVHMYIYIYKVCMHMCVHIYICIYIFMHLYFAPRLRRVGHPLALPERDLHRGILCVYIYIYIYTCVYIYI